MTRSDLLVDGLACLVVAGLLLFAVVADAQPATLNLNQQPIESRQGGTRLSTRRQFAIDCGANMTCVADGGVLVLSSSGGGSGGAPTNATYITQTADATLTNEQALSSNTTGLMVSTTGTGVVSTYAGATCGAGAYAAAVSSTGGLTCTTPPGTYTLPDATAAVTGGIRLTTDLGGSATAPTVVDDSHNHTGTTISALDTGDVTTGTLPQARGGTGAGALTCGAGDFLTSNGTAYSCATPSGGGGGYNLVQDEGSSLTARTTIDFTGAGVTCADTGSKTACDIPGGGGSGGSSPLSLMLGTP